MSPPVVLLCHCCLATRSTRTDSYLPECVCPCGMFCGCQCVAFTAARMLGFGFAALAATCLQCLTALCSWGVRTALPPARRGEGSVVPGQHAVCVLRKRTQRQSCLMQACGFSGNGWKALRAQSESRMQNAMQALLASSNNHVPCACVVPCRAVLLTQPTLGAVACHWTGSPAFLLWHLSGCLRHLSGCRFCLLQTWAVLAWGLVKSGALLAGWWL